MKCSSIYRDPREKNSEKTELKCKIFQLDKILKLSSSRTGNEMTLLGGHVTIFSQFPAQSLKRLTSSESTRSMEVPGVSFFSFSVR